MPDNAEIVTKVPRDPSGISELLTDRPVAWEWIYFAAELVAARQRVQTKFRDYTLGYTMNIGPVVPKYELAEWVSERMSRGTFIASNLEKVISKPAQDAAFGLPGEPGDPELIKHMANRLIGMYELLLDWVDSIRAARLPEGTDQLKASAVSFMSQPVAEVHRWVDEYVSNLETALSQLAAGSTEPMVVEMIITFEIPDGVAEEFNALLRKAVK